MTKRQQFRQLVKAGSMKEMMDRLDSILEEEYRQENRRPDISFEDWILEANRQG